MPLSLPVQSVFENYGKIDILEGRASKIRNADTVQDENDYTWTAKGSNLAVFLRRSVLLREWENPTELKSAVFVTRMTP
eukprot:4856746-Amphidinium_carterae.1